MARCATSARRSSAKPCRALPRAQVVFNYLGQFDGRPQEGAGGWTLAPEPAGPAVDGGAPLTHEFTVNGRVLAGELSMDVLFSGARHDAAAVRGWMADFERELRALIDHCAQAPQGATPRISRSRGWTRRAWARSGWTGHRWKTCTRCRPCRRASFSRPCWTRMPPPTATSCASTSATSMQAGCAPPGRPPSGATRCCAAACWPRAPGPAVGGPGRQAAVARDRRTR